MPTTRFILLRVLEMWQCCQNCSRFALYCAVNVVLVKPRETGDSHWSVNIDTIEICIVICTASFHEIHKSRRYSHPHNKVHTTVLFCAFCRELWTDGWMASRGRSLLDVWWGDYLNVDHFSWASYDTGSVKLCWIAATDWAVKHCTFTKYPPTEKLDFWNPATFGSSFIYSLVVNKVIHRYNQHHCVENLVFFYQQGLSLPMGHF